jgi:hypothetical protein
LDEVAKERKPRFVEHQGQADGYRQTEDKSRSAKKDGVGHQLAKVDRVEEYLKVLEANPGTAFDAQQRLKIFERDLRIVEWDVLNMR